MSKEEIKQKLKQELLKQYSVDGSLLSEEVLEEILQQARQELFKDVRVGRDLIIKGDIIQKVVQSYNYQDYRETVLKRTLKKRSPYKGLKRFNASRRGRK